MVMGWVSNHKKSKKIKTLKLRNVITSDWPDFLKNYPLVSAKLNNDKGEELKPFIRPSTKIKIYFNSVNITFYLIGVSGKEEKIPENVIYKSWDEVSMEELDELMR
jgi:hypothetical protein